MTQSSVLRLLVLTGLLLWASPTWACDFDTDCSPGSRCLKRRSEISGVCAGGLFPGNRYDHQPYEDPLDPTGTVGITCAFDTDCDPGQRCVKGRSSIEGVCLRKRR
jgi:hypothetical protein